MEISDFLESPVNSIFTHIASLEVLNPVHESSKKKKKSQRLNLGAVNYESPSPTNITNITTNKTNVF